MRTEPILFMSGPRTNLRMRLTMAYSVLSAWDLNMGIHSILTALQRQPIVTGTSVLALTYKDGIMMATDNLGVSFVTLDFCLQTDIFPASYGSLARFKDIQRLHPVGEYTVVGAGGDMSDFQYLQHILDDLIIEEEVNTQDHHKLGPAEVHEYLSNVMYARRSKINPLWNSLLVGGFKDGKK